ncbi:hypothetical protein [Ferrimonas balearica]|uniref:hypothetical protein n=1 Tax=Ferrimonas balearica TaxID=44012 RepID=UPI001C9A0B47|nr:hypothetical protein [Ferrimonas balearica]MBY5993511.1 hypothetical protein [Ferrimonas balearica]
MSQDPIDTLLSQTASELKPQRDLWPGIERQLDQPGGQALAPSPWARVAGFALPLLLGALLGLGGGYWAGQGPDRGQEAMLTMITVMAQQHEAQIQAAQSRYLTIGDTSGEPGEGQQTLKQASKELLQALKQDPFNPALLELWLWVQQKELDLIHSQQQQQRRLQQL